MEGAYDYSARITQQWPFGYGLSYTAYQYENLRVDKTHFLPGDTLSVSVDVTNTGLCEGKESVLLYSSDLVASVTPDGRRLRAFDKISLKPKETRTVTLRLPVDDLAFVGWDGKRHPEEGEFRISLAAKQVSVWCGQTVIK